MRSFKEQMQKLPDNVVSRLRDAQSPDTPHPGPDRLAAFAARQLPSRERDALLRHFARCAECRAVAAALAPEEPVRGTSRRWRTFRIGAVAAATACLVAIAIWNRSPGPVRRQTSVAGQQRETVLHAIPVAAQQRREPEKANAPRRRAKARSVRPKLAPVPAPPPQEVQTSETIEALSGSPLVASFAHPPAIQATASIDRRASAAVPAWSLSDDGTLLRSTDGGRTWQLFSLGQDTHLSALLSNRDGVWVGGGAGTVWHSEDGGFHWVRLQVPEQSGTVTQIRVPAPGLLEVTVQNDGLWEFAETSGSWWKVRK